MKTHLFKPRDYQEAAIDAAFSFAKYFEDHGYIKAPGGSGKSVMIAKLAERLYDAGYSVVILARSEKLVRQNREKMDCPYGTYSAGIGEKDASQIVTIGTIQSLANVTLDHKPDFALVDECDEIHPDKKSKTQYWKFFRNNGNPRIIGFTATDFRTASGLIQWGEKLLDIPIAPLFKKGYLVPPVNKVGADIDLSSVSVSMGEYSQEQLSLIYDDPELLRISVEKIIKYGATRNRSIVFCQSLKHCDIVANALEANGETVKTVSGDTCKEELTHEIFPAHEAGEFKHLINCQLLNVGVDLPWVDMIVMLMATKSKRKFEQCVYRGTRLYEGKQDFLVLDMGMNFYEHGALGSPLKEKKSKREAEAQSGKTCPECEEWTDDATAKECPACGYVFEVVEPPKIKHAYDADNESDPYYTGNAAPEIYDCTALTYKRKKSAKGNEMIIAEYHCDYGKYGTVADFLIPHHDNEFVRGRVYNHFEKHGFPIPYGLDLRDLTLDEIVREAENNLKCPNRIKVEMEKGFAKVKQVFFDNVEQESLELDDEIPTF